MGGGGGGGGGTDGCRPCCYGEPGARAHAHTHTHSPSSNCTHAAGTRATPQGQTEKLRASPRLRPPWTKPPTCATDTLLGLSSPLSQTHHHTDWPGQPARGSPQTRPRGAGAPQLPRSPMSLHPTMSHAHTQRPADPCTYPHLGGSVGRAAGRVVSGGRRAGSGAESGWWASAAAAPPWERASVPP